MNKEIDKSQSFAELCRRYLTGKMRLEILLKRLPQIGVSVSMVQDHEGNWACFQNNWTRFEKSKKGTEVVMWVPTGHFQPTPREAVIHLLDKLKGDKFVYLFRKDAATDEPDFSDD